MKPSNKPGLPPDACQELRELLPAYVVGATNQEEAERVQTLLAECPDVAAELETYAHITASLTQQAQPIAPPPDLRNRLLQQALASEGPPVVASPRRLSPQLGWWAAAALFALLLVTNFLWATTLFNSGTNTVNEQAENNQVIDLLARGQLQQVALRATDSTQNAVLATLTWDDSTNTAVLVTDTLPALDAAQAYQVWLIATGDPISAGLFQVDVGNRALLAFQPETDLTTVSAVAISVEPASGSPAPTTDPIAVGEIAPHL